MGDFARNLRIVNRFRAVRTAVFDGKSTRADVFDQLLFQLKSAVIGPNGYGLHYKVRRVARPRNREFL